MASKYGLPPDGMPGPSRPKGGYGLAPEGSNARGQPRPPMGSQTASRTQGGYGLPAPGMDKKWPKVPQDYPSD
jgi:hypothetical protein